MNGNKSYQGLAWVASIAFFMQALDTTILNTALPAIAQYFRESPLNMALAVISYALTLALFIPLSGWLADKYGTLRIFRLALLLFTLGSLTSALSLSLNMLIASRILQGMGGAMMMPVARLTIIKTVPKHHLINIWNLMAMSGLIGPILGPTIGGFLVTYASWHWIFLINLPIGIFGTFIASKFMPNITGETLPFDKTGFCLFAGGLVALTLGLEMVASKIVEKTTALYCCSFGLILLFGYYTYAKQATNRLLPLSLFKLRTFRIGILANFLLRLCGSGIPFLLPLMLQVSFHYTADTVGLLMTPIAIASLLTKPYIPKLLQYFGYKKTLIATALSIALSLLGFGMVKITTPLWLYLLLVIYYSANMSLMFTSINTLTISDVNEQNASTGSTFLSVIQQVGISIATALASVILSIYQTYFAENHSLQTAFSYTFFSLSALSILLISTLVDLHKDDGKNLHHSQND